MTNRHALALSFLAFSSLTGSLTGQTVAPGASVAPMSLLPPVGFTATETLQVNVTNAAAPSLSGGLAPACGGTIAFYFGGSLVGTVASFSVGGFSPATPQVISTALPYASTGASGGRIVVLAVITPATVAPSSDGLIPPCALVSSLETFDTASGATHVFVSGVAAQSPAAMLRSDVRLFGKSRAWLRILADTGLPIYAGSIFTAKDDASTRAPWLASAVGFPADFRRGQSLSGMF